MNGVLPPTSGGEAHPGVGFNVWNMPGFGAHLNERTGGSRAAERGILEFEFRQKIKSAETFPMLFFSIKNAIGKVSSIFIF